MLRVGEFAAHDLVHVEYDLVQPEYSMAYGKYDLVQPEYSLTYGDYSVVNAQYSLIYSSNARLSRHSRRSLHSMARMLFLRW